MADRHSPEMIERIRRPAAGVLSAEDYPELKPIVRPGGEAAPPPALDEDAICREVEEGRLPERSPEECRRLLLWILDLGRVSTFVLGAEQLMAGLGSDEVRARRWSLEVVWALGAGEEQALIPHGTFPLFLGGVGRCLLADAEESILDFAVECAALLLGAVAVSGDLEGAGSHLTRIVRDAGPSGPALRGRILSSTSLALVPLRLYAREGRSVLEGRILPLFRLAGPDGARGLIRCLEHEENRQRRSRILELLKALAPMSAGPVMESLEAEAWYLVRNALNLLGELGATGSFEAAGRFLEHPDARVRRAAVRAFWKTGGLRAESRLLELLPQCDPEAQGEILVGLAQMRAPSAPSAIARLAATVGEPLRVRCIEALGQLGQPESIPFLAKCLAQGGWLRRDREPASVREAAARALRAIGTPEAIELLARAVRDARRSGDHEALRRILEQPGWA